MPDPSCRRRLRRVAVAAALVPGLVACTAMADRFAPQPAPAARGGTPTVVGTRGPLPEREAEAVVAALRREGHTDVVARWLALMRQTGTAPLVVGNATRLLVDGPETHRAMFDAIARARSHVHLETYIIEADETGHRLAELLLERRRQGVEVALLYDAVGGIRAPAAYFDRLKDGGVHVCQFNPVNPLAGRGVTLNHRDHRKILVVDGRIAYTGGINVSDVYASGSASARRRAERGGGWRDTHVEIRGPAVAELQKRFVDSWTRQGCTPARDVTALPPPQPQPPQPPQGDRVLRVVASSPRDARSTIRDEWLAAMRAARRSIRVTMAYFVPDPETLDVLEAAARRGVEVTLVLPGFSDFWAVLAAGRSHYDRLLAAGVRIRERHDALLHAKTAVIDGAWSTVGSANMDWRSFLHNDEVSVIVLGEGFGQEMERMFADDLARSVPVTAADRAARGLADRAKERVARWLEYWL